MVLYGVAIERNERDIPNFTTWVREVCKDKCLRQKISRRFRGNNLPSGSVPDFDSNAREFFAFASELKEAPDWRKRLDNWFFYFPIEGRIARFANTSIKRSPVSETFRNYVGDRVGIRRVTINAVSHGSLLSK
jgi:hypothetical protein